MNDLLAIVAVAGLFTLFGLLRRGGVASRCNSCVHPQADHCAAARKPPRPPPLELPPPDGPKMAPSSTGCP